MKHIVGVCALLILLGASQNPIVRVKNTWTIEIGNTIVRLPPNLMAVQDKTTGEVQLQIVYQQQCNPITEKMIGETTLGAPICVPESSGPILAAPAH